MKDNSLDPDGPLRDPTNRSNSLALPDLDTRDGNSRIEKFYQEARKLNAESSELVEINKMENPDCRPGTQSIECSESGISQGRPNGQQRQNSEHHSHGSPQDNNVDQITDPKCSSTSESKVADDVADKNDERCCRLLQKGTNPPNYKYIGLMFVALFSSSFTLTFLFPFLPDMTKWMGYTEEAKGYYVGLIASSVFAGRACGSFFWGWLSDIKGRKLVLLMTIAGNGLFSLLFGLSVNLPVAMVFRFLAGLANGTVGTAKTVLYEISDNTNQAISMSAIALAWGCGIIMGPTVGGYLASPCVKYPHVFKSEGFFYDFPFFLPSLVTMVVCAIAFGIVFWQYEETLQKKSLQVNVLDRDDIGEEEKPLTTEGNLSQLNICRSIESLPGGHLSSVSIENVYTAAESGNMFIKRKTESQDNISDKSSYSVSSNGETSLVYRNGNNVRTYFTDEETDDNEKKVPLTESDVKLFFDTKNCYSSPSLDASDHVQDMDVVEVSNHKNGLVDQKCDPPVIVYECQLAPLKIDQSKSRTLSSYCSSMWHSLWHSKLLALLRVSDVRNSILLYTVFSFGIIGSEDVFTIFLSTEPSLNGLGFDSNEIGLALGIVSVPLLVLNLIIFPFLEKKLGIKKTFMLWGIIIVITVQVMPMLYPLYNNKTVLWILLLLILLPERIAGTCCFSGVSLMINNSTTPQNAGTVNGIAMTFTALARTIAPTAGGSIYAWSVSYGADHLGPPFDHNLAFVLFGIVFFISVIQCLSLPERLNRQTKKT